MQRWDALDLVRLCSVTMSGVRLARRQQVAKTSSQLKRHDEEMGTLDYIL